MTASTSPGLPYLLDFDCTSQLGYCHLAPVELAHDATACVQDTNIIR